MVLYGSVMEVVLSNVGLNVGLCMFIFLVYIFSCFHNCSFDYICIIMLGNAACDIATVFSDILFYRIFNLPDITCWGYVDLLVDSGDSSVPVGSYNCLSDFFEFIIVLHP